MRRRDPPERSKANSTSLSLSLSSHSSKGKRISSFASPSGERTDTRYVRDSLCSPISRSKSTYSQCIADSLSLFTNAARFRCRKLSSAGTDESAMNFRPIRSTLACSRTDRSPPPGCSRPEKPYIACDTTPPPTTCACNVFDMYSLSDTLQVLSFVKISFRTGNTDIPYLSGFHKEKGTRVAKRCIASGGAFS